MLIVHNVLDVVGMVQSIKPEQNVTSKNMEGRTYIEFKITDHM